MIQGGDPLSIDNDPFNDGMGTSGEYVPQEFTDTPFERGTVAFGREAGSDNGGSCQFFICLTRTPEWDGEYNVFGRVAEGIEVAEAISEATLTTRDHPQLKYSPARKQVIRRVTIEYRPEAG
jgi:cyclophilin family peptidyl-prolyl cis-trans isomerase